MKLRLLWKRYNLSSILIFPILQHLTDKIYHTNGKLMYTFFQLAYANGFLNSYLLDKQGKYKDCLYIVFNRDKVIKKLPKVVKNKYYSLNEIILSSKFFMSIEDSYDKSIIVYKIKIPDYLKQDIDIIMEGKYSEVSSTFKNMVNVNLKTVPVLSNRTSMYLTTSNLAYKIINKSKSLRKKIEEELKIKIKDNLELFDIINFNKEILKY